MEPVRYRDLAEFGLLLVGSEEPAFDWLVGDDANGDAAAVLLNQSGKSIVVLDYTWRFTTSAGKTRTSRRTNLGSSAQMEVLCGQTQVVQDLSSFILPGSKRLITERGMFGKNLDVLPRDFVGGGGRVGPDRLRDPLAEVELVLDLAIFEDGLCAGPDGWGLFEDVTAALKRQRDSVQEILTALRAGASEGTIFEILLPLARHSAQASPILWTFANMAIHQLVHRAGPEFLAWIDELADASPIRLHRAA